MSIRIVAIIWEAGLKGHYRLAYNGMFITHASLWDMKDCVKIGPNVSPLERLIFNADKSTGNTSSWTSSFTPYFSLNS